ncbi:MAG: carboxymuconolactone decarboxylase family protein [Ilumatobacter sp.]
MTTEDQSGDTDEQRLARGVGLAMQLFAGLEASAPPLPSELERHTFGHLFGDVWQGPELDLQQRSMITCTVLVALGRESEMLLHFRGARNLGIERAALEAMISHVAHYAGWPVAVSAARVLDHVWSEMDAAAADGATT